VREYGKIVASGEGVARAEGLPGVRSEELVIIGDGKRAFCFNLEPDGVDLVLLDKGRSIRSGDEVRRTGAVLEVPVGYELIGRTIEPLGEPLQTGIQAIDALIPVGRGQRELILGDRQTGKTAIAVDTIINQKNSGVICIYCAIGQRASAVAKVISDLEKYGARDNTIVITAAAEQPPGLAFAAPFAAMSIAEYFMHQGEDTLVILDDLTRHARSYRELSLLLRRPPAREAYPGDIFYLHSRLLERATHLKEPGGSITAFPIIETQAQNLSAYIPTNLISITDGQILLTQKLYQQGVLPAIDVGTSVSRVGGKTQLPAYRSVAGDLRLSYSQFEELEGFAKFGMRLDENTRKQLERGRRVRQALQQPQYSPIDVPLQIALLLAVTEGVYDSYPVSALSDTREAVASVVEKELQGESKKILNGEQLQEAAAAADRYNENIFLALQVLMLNRPPEVRFSESHSSHQIIIAIGSDQGMVGQFNETVAEKTDHLLRQLKNHYPESTPHLFNMGYRIGTSLHSFGLSREEEIPMAGTLNKAVDAVKDVLELIASKSDRIMPVRLVNNRPEGGSSYGKAEAFP
jgi:F-type H+/Na+-transporting ATPase subunit alpha